MSDTDRVRVDALFDEALALPAGRRAAFVARLAAAEPSTAALVEELLLLAEQPAPDALAPGALAPRLLHAFLEQPDPTPIDGLLEGTRLGAWRVVREIGRGGMGTVYLVARADGAFVQRGALKLVRSALGSQEIGRRLRRERRILASLAHANIARLLDGGQTDDGRPFFVMEYVEGRPIDRYCDEMRLTIDERLDLFSSVCAGVQHAHRRLVVHRDIKPSNIIVTSEGEVKLLDFGIARLLAAPDAQEDGQEDEAVTQPAMRILTPEYATPEQVRGEPVAIASDVYQLGLLLYQLLTGQRAQSVTSTSPAALEQAICVATPPAPSQCVARAGEIASGRRLSPGALTRKLRGDLDTIVLCALRKEPDRRYTSVDEFVGDVQRYRMGLPIRARGDRLAYRARKFVARRRAALTWTAVLLALASIGLPALVSERLQRARETERAEQVEKLLASVFALQNPRARPMAPTALDYVDQAATLVRTELAGQEQSQARLLTMIGRVYNALGHYQQSVEALEKALALRVAIFGADSLETADTLEWLGQSRHYAGRYDQAESAIRDALRIRRLRLERGHPDTTRVMLELGDLLHTRGRLLESEPVLREALAACRALPLASRPEDLGHDSLPRALRDLASVLRDRGVLAEAGRHYEEAIALFRELHGEPDQQVATSQIYYARLLIMQSNHAAAERALEQSLAALRRIYEGDHALIGMAFRELGYLRIEQGRLEDAGEFLLEAERVLQVVLGGGHSMVTRTRAHQAELARRRGQATVAIRLARRTLDEFERLGMAEHPSAIDTRLTLGQALITRGTPAAAGEPLRRGLSSARRQFVAGDRRFRAFEDALERAANAPRHSRP
jgi:serine/threonine-protein kinase